MNPEHLKVVLGGCSSIAEWKKIHPDEKLDLANVKLPSADLYEADLSYADLSYAYLSLADLSVANLTDANLSHADLSVANLTDANLSHADLTDADLSVANLSYANLSQAVLKGASLSETSLVRTSLDDANFSEAVMDGAILAGINLAKADGLKAIIHGGPSSVGVDTMIESFRSAGNRFTPELEAFFLGTGVPKELLDSIPKIIGEVKYCPTYIAYGQPDVNFARRLKSDLTTNDVSCWLYDTDKTAGERTWKEIRHEMQRAEKVIVLCSAKALVRDGLLKEIEEQIDRDRDKLIAVSLDDLWKQDGFHVTRGSRNLKPDLMNKNWVDFIHNSTYDHSLNELLKGLRR